MRIQRITLTLALAATLAPLCAQDVEVDLQRAIQKETVTGDLTAAIAEYSKIRARAGSNRAVAAKAMLHLAECYQKLGDAKSREIYELVVADYGDQKDVAAAARARLSRPASPDGVANRKVWTLPRGASIAGRTSPDGRHVPYEDGQSGDLFLHDLVTNIDRRLTNTAMIKPGTPASEKQHPGKYAFSPDGKQLVYSWFRGSTDRYELRLVNLQGSGVPAFRTLVELEDVTWLGPRDWSRDGKWIAITLWRKDNNAQIGLVSAQDGSFKVLKSVDWRNAYAVFFSPDSQYLAFDLPAGEALAQRDIFVMAVDGSRETPAIVSPSNDSLVGWTPDGKYLLFASDRSGSPDLWARRFTNGKTDGPPELVKRDIGIFDNMGVAASGSLYYVAFTRNGANIMTSQYDFDKGDFVSPWVSAVQTHFGGNHSPDWSRDGKYLAWASYRGLQGSPYHVICLRSMQTGQVRDLLPLPSFPVLWSLSWGHDSRSLLVSGKDAKGRVGIFRVDAETGRGMLIGSLPSGVYAVDDSPDGKSTYYAVQGPSQEYSSFVKRDLADGTETTLIEGTFVARFFLSPDGRHLAVQRRDLLNIQVVATTGGQPRTLMEASRGQKLIPFGWTPDSHSMLISKVLESGDVEVWRVPLDGGQPLRLEGTRKFANNMVRVHPDGRQVAFSMHLPAKPEEVWVLENFLSTLTAAQ